MSTRERLLQVLAALGSYGIAPAAAYGAEPDRARAELRAAILARHPHAAGSFIFWTAADDRHFGRDGELEAPLTLHTSGPDVVRAATLLLEREGLHVLPTGDGATLHVQAQPCTRAA
jgi:hypothetical protein